MSINQEEFKEMLKAKGLKVTNQRLIVLKVLDKHRDIHMAAEDIYKLVKAECPDIGLATVYRIKTYTSSFDLQRLRKGVVI